MGVGTLCECVCVCVCLSHDNAHLDLHVHVDGVLHSRRDWSVSGLGLARSLGDKCSVTIARDKPTL